MGEYMKRGEHGRKHWILAVEAMFKKSFIVNFSVGLRFEISRLSAD
jgi:hypothetical protein